MKTSNTENQLNDLLAIIYIFLTFKRKAHIIIANLEWKIDKKSFYIY